MDREQLFKYYKEIPTEFPLLNEPWEWIGLNQKSDEESHFLLLEIERWPREHFSSSLKEIIKQYREILDEYEAQIKEDIKILETKSHIVLYIQRKENEEQLKLRLTAMLKERAAQNQEFVSKRQAEEQKERELYEKLRKKYEE